jgi:REP element-mobilizing transposase RayT
MFGNIVDGNMVLNAYGGIVRACWNDLPNHYANVVLDEFIIMPDHIHGIIIIRDIVGAGFKPAHGNADPAHGNATNDNGTNRAGLKPAPTDGNQSEKRHGLSEIIRAFKTFSSRRINKTGQSFQWQRNYYEHIIRTQKTLFSIRQYIRENAMNAELDSENH